MAAGRKTGIYLPQEVEDILSAFVSRYLNVDAVSAKISEIIKDYGYELMRAKKEIEGVFTENELMYIRDMSNGSLLTNEMHPGSTLIVMVEDSDTYDELGEKWSVDVKKLVEKIKGLTSFQAYTLMKVTDEWWRGQMDKSDEEE